MSKDERTMVDASVARCVADITEHLSELNAAITDVKWRLVRGEPGLMPIHLAKKAINNLKNEVRSLEYAIEQAIKPDGEPL